MTRLNTSPLPCSLVDIEPMLMIPECEEARCKQCKLHIRSHLIAIFLLSTTPIAIPIETPLDNWYRRMNIADLN